MQIPQKGTSLNKQVMTPRYYLNVKMQKTMKMKIKNRRRNKKRNIGKEEEKPVNQAFF